MTRRFERHPDELISASLTGDLTDVERGQLETHLAGCERCRQTLDAFLDQRRLLSGMRHLPAPRDLGARVSAGVAATDVEQPWFRRPSSVIGAFSGVLALAAGVLVAALLTGQPVEGPVAASGEATPTERVTPSEPLPTATMTSAPTPEPTPEPVLAVGDTGYLSMTGTNVDPQLSVQRVPADGQGETVTTLEPTSQPPVAAFLSPDGQWLAYQTFSWGKGTNHAWLVRLTDGHTIDLGEAPGDPFGRQMAWFGASKELLAYTGLTEDPAGATTDVWVADTVSGAKVNVTNNGAAYVGSFVPNTDLLWISVAGSSPNSFLVDLTPTDAGVGRVDLSQTDPVEGVFQPILNPGGDRAIFWRGAMAGEAHSRHFESGGMLLVEEAVDGDFSWEGRSVLEYVATADTVNDPNLLVSASLSWAPDGDTFAVWRAQFQGQGELAGTFPDRALLYVGRVSTGAALNRESFSYGDRFAEQIGTQIIDVEFATDSTGTPNALLVTVQLDAGAEGPGQIATATIVRVDLADGSEEELAPSAGAWHGPAVWVAPEAGEG